MQFSSLVKPGLNCIMWPCKDVVGTISTRVQQLDVKCETKTLDNVFVQCELCWEAVSMLFLECRVFSTCVIGGDEDCIAMYCLLSHS